MINCSERLRRVIAAGMHLHVLTSGLLAVGYVSLHVMASRAKPQTKVGCETLQRTVLPFKTDKEMHKYIKWENGGRTKFLKQANKRSADIFNSGLTKTNTKTSKWKTPKRRHQHGDEDDDSDDDESDDDSDDSDDESDDGSVSGSGEDGNDGADSDEEDDGASDVDAEDDEQYQDGCEEDQDDSDEEDSQEYEESDLSGAPGGDTAQVDDLYYGDEGDSEKPARRAIKAKSTRHKSKSTEPKKTNIKNKHKHKKPKSNSKKHEEKKKAAEARKSSHGYVYSSSQKDKSSKKKSQRERKGKKSGGKYVRRVSFWDEEEQVKKSR